MSEIKWLSVDEAKVGMIIAVTACDSMGVTICSKGSFLGLMTKRNLMNHGIDKIAICCN